MDTIVLGGFSVNKPDALQDPFCGGKICLQWLEVGCYIFDTYFLKYKDSVRHYER